MSESTGALRMMSALGTTRRKVTLLAAGDRVAGNGCDEKQRRLSGCAQYSRRRESEAIRRATARWDCEWCNEAVVLVMAFAASFCGRSVVAVVINARLMIAQITMPSALLRQRREIEGMRLSTNWQN